ncbi:cysteinyl leukotriene receptor 2 [Oncorhynchus mykiss]|uniref:Si:dkey-216e24.9 n=1 Tax=Oncorhynchus mykiss TaxID=8022 RepID=A0A8C7T102_ONCMY|nr:cysteinyl leukotriene receptor 2 [Oncorhynchus mykiss]
MNITTHDIQQMSSVNPSGHWLNGTRNDPQRQCWLHPDPIDTQVKPWLYLALSLLGFLANGLTLREFMRSGRTPTVILTLNMVTSDLLLCTSFLFRVVYYRRGHIWSGEDTVCQAAMLTMITVFYVNLYCNIMLLLWTSVTRYATVVRPCPALLVPFTRPRECWVLCLVTWVTVVTVVSANVVLQFGRGKGRGVDSCFDMLENHHREALNNQHCLGVALFFVILTFILVNYGGLVLYLQKVRGSKNTNTSEGGAREGRGVSTGVTAGDRRVSCEVEEGCGVSLGETEGRGENIRGVDLEVHSGAGERQRMKSGSLRVRRKILAVVVVFVACFLPYHVQRAVTLLSPHGGDCEKLRTQWKAKNATITIAALSCIVHPLLHLALRHLPCCRRLQ